MLEREHISGASHERMIKRKQAFKRVCKPEQARQSYEFISHHAVKKSRVGSANLGVIEEQWEARDKERNDYAPRVSTYQLKRAKSSQDPPANLF